MDTQQPPVWNIPINAAECKEGLRKSLDLLSLVSAALPPNSYLINSIQQYLQQYGSEQREP